MTLFIILNVVVFSGIGIAFWLIKNEDSSEDRFDSLSPTPIPSLKEKLDKIDQQEKQQPKTEATTPKPAAVQIPKPKLSEQSINQTVENSLKFDELKSKYDRLDKLLQEKSAQLESVQTDLDNERKHRKEFNKVKDILEKELSDTKTALKNTEREGANLQEQNRQCKLEIEELKEKLSEKEEVVQEQVQAQPEPEETPPATPEKEQEPVQDLKADSTEGMSLPPDPVAEQVSEKEATEDKSEEEEVQTHSDPAQQQPVEAQPAEDKPAEDKPAENKPEENPSTDNQPAQDQQPEQAPEENKPPEDKEPS